MTAPSLFQVITGWNDIPGLVTLDPQPSSSPISYFAMVEAISGKKFPDGISYMAVLWKEVDRAQYNSVMAAHGITQDVLTNKCTVCVRLNDDTFAYFNCYASYDPVRKPARRDMVYWHGLEITYTELVSISE